jgi:predicted GIY-YIG superfamily endonuclease
MAVYLIHFSIALAHARHYVGYAKSDVAGRLAEHCAGAGARLTQVAVERGASLELARVWPEAGRQFERQIKRRKEAPRLCPVCAGDKAAGRAIFKPRKEQN